MTHVVVIDVDGVLGDVTREDVGILLPTGDHFYLNSGALYLIETLLYYDYPMVLWSSLSAKDTEPIERAPEIEKFPFVLKLHAEDYCPVKKASYLRARLPEDLQNARIVFVDDGLLVCLDDVNSSLYECESFEVTKNNTWNLQEMVNRFVNNDL